MHVWESLFPIEHCVFCDLFRKVVHLSEYTFVNKYCRTISPQLRKMLSIQLHMGHTYGTCVCFFFTYQYLDYPIESGGPDFVKTLSLITISSIYINFTRLIIIHVGASAFAVAVVDYKRDLNQNNKTESDCWSFNILINTLMVVLP